MDISPGKFIRSLPLCNSCRAMDLVTGLALFVFALIVRWPYLVLVPPMTDETIQTHIALDIASGGNFPLTAADPYQGPLFHYLLAAVFSLLDKSIYLPRGFSATVGALTVVATYGLGRALGGRLVGLIAAGLMATSGTQVFVNGHMAIPNATTPLFTTLALLTWYVAGRDRQGPLLALSAFLWGLALQTHSSPLVMAPALLAWLLLGGGPGFWLKRPWLYLAANMALLGLGPLLLYNIQHPLSAVGAASQRLYFYSPATAWPEYRTRLALVTVELLQMVTGTYDIHLVFCEQIIRRLDFIVYTILLTLGFLVTLRRDRGFTLSLVLSSLLIIAYFNKYYMDDSLATRYVAFLLPLCYSAMGLLLAGALRHLRSRRHDTGDAGGPFAASRLYLLAAGLVCAGLVLFPLRPLAAYYRRAEAEGMTNAPMLWIVEALDDVRAEGQPVHLDKEMKDVNTGAGENALRALRLFLVLKSIHDDPMDQEEIEKLIQAPPKGGAMLVLARKTYDTLEGRERLALVEPGLYRPPQYKVRYALYRLAGE
jgi:hypothetical protein